MDKTTRIYGQKQKTKIDEGTPKQQLKCSFSYKAKAQLAMDLVT